MSRTDDSAAGGGSGLLPAQIGGWDAAGLLGAAAALGSLAAHLQGVGGQVGASRPLGGRWDGDAAGAADLRVDATARTHASVGDLVAHWASLVVRAATAVSAAQRAIALVEVKARAQFVDIVGSRGVAQPITPDPDPAVAEHIRQVREGTAAEVTVMLAQVCVQLEAELAAVGAGLAAGSGSFAALLGLGSAGIGPTGVTGWSALTGILDPSGVPAPPAEGGAAAASAWWAALTDADRATVLAMAPDSVAHLEGIPIWARDVANRNLLAATRADLQRRLALAPHGALQVLGRAVGEESSFAYDNLRAQLASLDAIDAELAGRPDGMQSTLIDLDLSGRLARASIGLGDVDHAEHLGVFVGGLTSSVDGSLAKYSSDFAATLQHASRLSGSAGDGGRVAGIVFMGYEAPQWSDTGDPDRSVLMPNAAQAGAPALARLLDGVQASRSSRADITVVAHSYGGLAAAYALRKTTAVRGVVLMGVPGLGATGPDAGNLWRNGTDPGAFRVGGARNIHVIEAAGDPVAAVGKTGRFGVDPDTIPGVDKLSAWDAVLPDGEPAACSGGHSDYLTAGTTSEHNVAAVIADTHDVTVPDAQPDPDDLHPVPGVRHAEAIPGFEGGAPFVTCVYPVDGH